MLGRNLTFAVASVTIIWASQGAAEVDRWGLTQGTVELQSAGAMTFGPDGILFVGDTKAGAIHAIQTSDAEVREPATEIQIKGLSAKLADLLNSPEPSIKIHDLAVNPLSGTVYLSISAGAKAEPAIVKVGQDGTLSKLSLNAPHARAVLSDVPESQVGRRGDPRDDAITDLIYRDGKLLVAGLAAGQAPSTVRELIFPFNDRVSAMNIEIYHAAHGRLEDYAPVRTFAPMVIDGEPALLAGFTCTPLVRFPVASSQKGEKVRGTTVAELGNRNRPLDMVIYQRNGQSFVLMANSARGVMKINLDAVDENPGLTEPVRGGGTAGQPFETVKDLEGVEQLDLLSETHAVVVTRASDGSVDLSTILLP